MFFLQHHRAAHAFTRTENDHIPNKYGKLIYLNLQDIIVFYCRPPSLLGLRRRGGGEERFEEMNLFPTEGKGNLEKKIKMQLKEIIFSIFSFANNKLKQ